jgi:ELWxxDGT repeat protein
MMAAPLFEALLPRTTKTALRWLYRCIVGALTIVIAASNCVPVDAIALAQPGSLRPIEIAPGRGGSYPWIDGGVALGDNFIFDANDTAYGYEPWVTDGTQAGTHLLADIDPGSRGSRDIGSGYVSLGGMAYFLVFKATTIDSGWQLWTSDGTPAGTMRAAWIFTEIDTMFGLKVAGKYLYWLGTSGDFMWLYRSDGTQEGTKPVYAFAAGDCYQQSTSTSIGSTLFFVAKNLTGKTGCELWKSNGTRSGTKLVKDIYRGDSNPVFLVPKGKLMYFSLFDKAEVWRTDGTTAGTKRIASICRKKSNCSVSAIWPLGSTVLFAGDDGINGTELWRTSGTPSSAKMVKNVRKGTDAFVNTEGVGNVIGNRLYFWADDGVHGMEPWVSDGTSRGTRLVADINVGSPGSAYVDQGDYLHATPFISIFSGIFFGANAGSGSRLFVLKGSVPSQIASELPMVKPPKRDGWDQADVLGLKRAGLALYSTFCSSSLGCEMGVLSESP